jgi:ribonuclease HI
LDNEVWEEKGAFVLAPWENPITCVIESQEAALETHSQIFQQAVMDQNKRTKMVFTDGTGYEGHIGASTACLLHGVTSERRYLGTDSQSTVYAAELNGIEMALAAARQDNKGRDSEGHTAREVIIFSDSQAAIQAVQNPQRPSGQYVLTRVYEHVRAIRSQNQRQDQHNNVNITIRWIPAHVDVAGNDINTQLLLNKKTGRNSTRWLNMRYSFVKDAAAKGYIDLERVESKANVADGFTKPLGEETFPGLITQLGM